MNWRKIKCFFGFHALNTMDDRGEIIIQRCLYCDQLVNMYERDKENIIRRVR